MTEDDQLMVRLQGGDARAFDELVALWHPRLIGFFRRNTRDLQLAEDLAQETLLKLHNQFWDYLPVGKFRAWIFRIARNLLIDDVRRRSHDLLLQAYRGHHEDEHDSLGSIPDDLDSTESQVDHRELSALVNQTLDEIPEDQRLTFTLHHFAGLGLSEISEVLEVPLATSKSRLRLAREKLALRLRELGIPSV